MKLKNVEQVEMIDVDPNTGEIKKTYTTKSMTYSTKVSAERFYMTFIDMINPIVGIGGITDRRVLDLLCTAAEFDTGKVGLYPKFKDSICEKLKINKQTLANSLTNLKKGGFIVVDRGELTISPMFFWKGTLEQRAKLLETGRFTLKIGIENEQ